MLFLVWGQAGTPGLTSPPPWGLYLGGALLCLGAALSLWAGRTLPQERSTAGLALAVALLAWSGLSALLSLDPFSSSLALASAAAGTGLLAAFWVGIGDRQDFILATRLVVGGAAVISLAALASWLAQADPGRLQGHFTNPDTFSVIPLVGYFLTLGLAHARGLSLTAATMVGFLFLMTLLATGCRAAALGWVLGMVAAAVMLRVRTGSWSASLRPMILVVVFAVCVGLASLKLPTVARVVESTGTLTTSDELRIITTLHGLRASAGHVLVGAGPGAFPVAYQAYRPENQTSAYANAAHCDPVQVAVELGWPGFLLWLGLHVVAIGHALKARTGYRGLGVGAAAGLVALLGFSAVNFVLPVPNVALWWYALLGLCLAAPAREQVRASEAVKAAAVVLAVAALPSALTGARAWVTEQSLERARVLEARLHWEEAYAELQSARELGSRDPRLGLAQSGLAVRAAYFRADPVWFNRAVEALEGYPQGYLPVLVRRARLYLKEGDAGAARAALQEAVKQAPYHWEVRWELAELELALGELEAAAHSFAPASRFDPRARERLAMTLAAMDGRGLELFAELTEGRDPGYRFQLAEALAEHMKDPEPLYRSLKTTDRLEPAQAAVLSRLADRAGHPEDALEYLEDLAQPPLREALNDWIAARRRTKETGLLRTRLEALVQAHPEEHWLRLELARSLPPKEARRVLQEGLEKSPEPVLLEALGDLYRSQGMEEAARRAYQDALELVPGSPELEKKLKLR